jgi:hypothetical protein
MFSGVQIDVSGYRHPGRWATRLAFRSTLIAACALVAAYIVDTRALPTLSKEMGEAVSRLPVYLRWLVGLRDWLLYVPIPGLVLGLAALILRPLRSLLAPLAALASLLAVAAIVGTLVVTLMPIYQVPADLDGR